MEEVVQNIPQRFNKKYFEIQHYKAKSKIMGNQVAVHTKRNSEKVVKFINQDSLISEVSKLIENGNLHGLYYDENGNIVAEDIWGDVYENIFKAGK